MWTGVVGVPVGRATAVGWMVGVHGLALASNFLERERLVVGAPRLGFWAALVEWERVLDGFTGLGLTRRDKEMALVLDVGLV